MTIQVARLGTPRRPGEGVRLGTVRRPPRGVPKSEFSKRDFYDVWPPDLAPSQAALSHQTNLAVGCYCEDEARCDRSVLRELLEEHGAEVSHGT